MNREQRRNRKQLEKEKAKRFLKDVWHQEDLAHNESYVGKRAKTRVPCSCYMCGNPRHHWKTKKVNLTMQEQRAMLNGDDN